VLDLDEFRARGFVRVRGAVPRDLAAGVHSFATELVPDDGSAWSLGQTTVYDFPSLAHAISPIVRQAFDALLGQGGWFVDANWGFPTRFGGSVEVGWHVDGDWFHHHIDSPEQVLTPIFLWHDVGEDDAPTLLAPGSHVRVAEMLAELEPTGMPGAAHRQAVHPIVDGAEAVPAVGDAGDVYACHPLLAHSIHPDGPAGGRRVVSNVCVHGRRRRPLDQLPWT
jgi:Phytanoyl-CoA dioxygenase (PhyH)